MHEGKCFDNDDGDGMNEYTVEKSMNYGFRSQRDKDAIGVG